MNTGTGDTINLTWKLAAVIRGDAGEAIFRAISQTSLHYPESRLNAGAAGKISGGERLLFLRFESRDNYASLSTVAWQVHFYGVANPDLQTWCAANGVALHIFDWQSADHLR